MHQRYDLDLLRSYLIRQGVTYVTTIKEFNKNSMKVIFVSKYNGSIGYMNRNCTSVVDMKLY